MIVSGQAHLGITGLLLGQEIVASPQKDYFITYDVDYLATVAPNANIGFEFPTTSYIKLQSPDIVDSVNIGFAPSGLTASTYPSSSAPSAGATPASA